MTIQVNIGEAKTRLSELLARVEAGEELVIARSGQPLFEVRLIEKDRSAAQAALKRLLANRTSGKVSVDDILSWRDEGRR